LPSGGRPDILTLVTVAMKNHKISIAGSTFIIRSDVSEDRIRQIEQYLNDNVEEVRGKARKVPYTDGLVLVLFRLADTLIDGQVASRETVASAASDLRAIRAEIDEIGAMIRDRLASMDEGAS
jgi:hypothetical protein